MVLVVMVKMRMTRAIMDDDEWMDDDGWVGGWMNGWMGRWMDGKMDIDKWRGGCRDGWRMLMMTMRTVMDEGLGCLVKFDGIERRNMFLFPFVI